MGGPRFLGPQRSGVSAGCGGTGWSGLSTVLLGVRFQTLWGRQQQKAMGGGGWGVEARDLNG